MRSTTHESFQWPRLVPLRANVSQPPLRTANRLFCCRDPEGLSKQENFQDYTKRTSGLEKLVSEDDSALMSRKKFMLLNENSGVRTLDMDRGLKSTIQLAYGPRDHIEVSYEDLMKQSRDKDGNLEPTRLCLKLRRLADPFPFIKKIDEKPLLG